MPQQLYLRRRHVAPVGAVLVERVQSLGIVAHVGTELSSDLTQRQVLAGGDDLAVIV
jgi:hypothetical protein